MHLRVLSAADIRAALDMTGAIEAVAEAFAQLSSRRARVPLRTALESASGVTLLMPAYLEASAGLGAKIVSVFEGNAGRGLPAVTALVLLLDADTGVPRAVLDGTYLTALRTGAASGLATRLLAREDAAVVALFGAGGQARAQLEAVRAVRPTREVRIVSRSVGSARLLAGSLEGVSARAVADPGEAVRGAHIIIAATTSRTPVFDGRLVEPGAHVNGIGSFTAEMQELDASLIRRALVVVDSREAALAEAGDILIPIRDGVIGPDHIHAELGELVLGARPGRTAADQVTVFKSVGNAAQDVAVAARALEAAEARGLGTVVSLT